MERERATTFIHELLDLVDADGLALCPGGDLLNLVRERVQILLTDVLDQQRAGIGLGVCLGGLACGGRGIAWRRRRSRGST